MSGVKIISNNVEETIGLGERLAKKLKKGDCLALVGDLGTGKTIFTKGTAKGLGVKNIRKLITGYLNCRPDRNK